MCFGALHDTTGSLSDFFVIVRFGVFPFTDIIVWLTLFIGCILEQSRVAAST